MKAFIPTIALLLAAATAFASKPNPADFPLTVHVVGSANRGNAVILETIIEDQPCELAGGDAMGNLVKLGDYRARYVPQINKFTRAYEFAGNYEFYFAADGTTRKYSVIAIGTAVPH